MATQPAAKPKPADLIADLIAALAPACVLALLLGGAAALLAFTMSPAERAALWALVEPRLALLLMLWAVLALAGGVLLQRAWQQHGAAPGRLAEAVQVLVNTDAPPRLESVGSGLSAGSRALAIAVNTLVLQRNALQAGIEDKVREASRNIDQERQRLAALVADLPQSVVVCNLDGRILLFNARARLQFRALAGGEGAAVGGAVGGAVGAMPISGFDAIGLGRSIYAVLDRRLVAHALEAVQQRLQRGVANPSTQFVTGTRNGQLLRVQMTPVKAPGANEQAPLNGYVLMLENITRDMAEDHARDALLHTLTQEQRGSLGRLQALVEQLPQSHEQTDMRAAAAEMAARINEAAATGLQALKTRWPLEDMLGSDFVSAAARRIQTQLEARVLATDVDAQVWLRVDSYSLIQALLHLAGRLADEYEVRRVQLRLSSTGTQAQLDLVWAVQAMSTETVTAWESEPLQTGLPGERSATPLTVRDVLDRHGGTLWFERDRIKQEAFFRLLLPLASAAPALEAAAVTASASRPEFYDFDLFAQAQKTGAEASMLDRPLAELNYTVFDTETTGLQPSEGDEIIQIGATRIVAGKLRRQDCFEQLIDPQRPLSAAGIAIHGIQPQMLQGQPSMAAVLPVFHEFAQDTVLVAHNAAFDMRFLQLKEAATGIRFEQPVLDTLLLSAVVHPQQASHRLEAIAERLGVAVLGRHTALGDAMVTAEVFQKLLPLLQAQGITTLAQALAASKQTYLARVAY